MDKQKSAPIAIRVVCDYFAASSINFRLSRFRTPVSSPQPGCSPKVIVGTSGCSSHFFIGLLSVFELSLESDLKTLNRAVLADTSLNWRGRYIRPACGFHANDDMPEVRELVFRLLAKHKVKF